MTTFTTEDRENAQSYTVNVPTEADYLHDYKMMLIIDKAMELPNKEMGEVCLKVFGSYTLGKWVKKWQERLGLNLPVNKKWML
jgi:hypothetical protein